jgi:hypothetical protein
MGGVKARQAVAQEATAALGGARRWQKIGFWMRQSDGDQRTELAREADGWPQRVIAVRHAAEMRLLFAARHAPTRSRSGMNWPQTVIASFMQALWSS